MDSCDAGGVDCRPDESPRLSLLSVVTYQSLSDNRVWPTCLFGVDKQKDRGSMKGKQR